jgi:hypothetical protein
MRYDPAQVRFTTEYDHVVEAVPSPNLGGLMKT